MESDRHEHASGTRTREGLYLLLAFALVELLVHLVAVHNYGYFRDELYYVACSEHLAWGYVDHPPLSILLLWASRRLLGDSLPALRLLPALAGAGTVFLTGWISRRMGGGGLAQALAMISVIVSPLYLYESHVYSMNAFDVLFWTIAGAVLVRIFDGGPARLWIVLGVVLGLGLLNKISILWFGFGLTIGLRLTPQRGWYMTRWPWMSGTLAFLLFLPHLVWQAAHGWPTLEFIRNATRMKMAPVGPLRFAAEQVLLMNPVTLPVWGTGLAFLFFAANGRRFRPFAFLYLTVFLLLVSVRTSRPSYLAPAYPVLFAAGGVAIEGLVARSRKGWPKLAWLALPSLGGLALAPTGVPILPVETYIRYAKLLRVEPSTDERKEIGALPQHYADMFGWEEMVQTVARAYDSLPPDEKAKAAIFAQNYGEAGAIDFYGPRYGLPRAMSGHNNYWLWGPAPGSGDVVIVLGGDEDGNREACGELERVGATDCAYCMPYENHLPVYVCRHLKESPQVLWPRLKHFD